MKWKQHKSGSRIHRISLPTVLLPALCCLAGLLLGQAAMACVPDSTGEELRRYLQEFAALKREETRSLPVVLRTLALYLRYPVLAFWGGFSALGLALIPCAAAAFGFFLSFAVCCFAATFGGAGILLALALMGIRCAVTLPCFLLLAGPALERSGEAALAALGRGRRDRRNIKGDWLRFGAAILILLAGLCADGLLSPWLLEAALAGITP